LAAQQELPVLKQQPQQQQAAVEAPKGTQAEETGQPVR
jgi:hypothetical protein